MPDLSALTEKQRLIYDFIAKFIDEKGYPPTVRDIGEHFKIESPNGVMCHLTALVKKGVITRKGQSARAIQLVGHTRSSAAELPLVGTVAAGQPIDAVETDEKFNFQDAFGGPNHFVLQVRGTSMIEDHIEDGDYVVIRKQDTAENGQRVVAMIDREVTLKKFYRRDGKVILQPCNSEMSPIEVSPESDSRILGLLVGVMRKVR
jgi:repressor LexA